MKELRNGNLIAAIKTNLPHVGFVKLNTESNGRKASFSFRGFDFLVSSRLMVKEFVFGRTLTDTTETEISKELQTRLRSSIA